MDVKGGFEMHRRPAITGRVIIALVLCTTFSFGSTNLAAQSDTLRMEIGNESGYIGQQVIIPIYLSAEMAETDSCGGFDISVSLSRPDLMYFEVDTTTVDTVIEGDPPETTYVDIDTSYVCQFDTTGTLASGWDVVRCRSTIGKGLEMELVGLADYMFQGNHAIPPNTSGVLLEIFGRIHQDVPDTLTDRIVDINAGPFCYYSDTHGELIEPSKNTDGSVEVEQGERGDVNCDGDIDPLDVSYIINRVYKGWDVLCSDVLGDIDCSGNLDPVDATYLVNRVYKSWPFPDC
jgi:hypothetical protein